MPETREFTMPVQGAKFTMRTRVLGSDVSAALAASLDLSEDDRPAMRFILQSEYLAASLITEWDAKDLSTGEPMPVAVESLKLLDADDYEFVNATANNLRKERPVSADGPFGSASQAGSKATRSRRRPRS